MILIFAASRAVFADNGNGARGLLRPLMEFGACHNGSHPTLWHPGLLKQPDIKLRIPGKRAPPPSPVPVFLSGLLSLGVASFLARFLGKHPMEDDNATRG